MQLIVALVLGLAVLLQNQAVSFEQLTIGTTAVGLSQSTVIPPGKPAAGRCVGFLEGGPVRFRVDGPAPTATIGTLVPVGARVEIVGNDSVRDFKAIRSDATSGVLPVTCYQQ